MTSSTDLQAATDDEAVTATAAQALNFADPLALRGLLYQLTGDEELKTIQLGVLPGMFVGEMAGLTDPAEIGRLHEKVLAMLAQHRAGTLKSPPQTREHLREAISLAVGEEIADADADFWIEELALDSAARDLNWDATPSPQQLKDFHVVVVGAGLAGVNAAVRLKRAGIPFTVIEKNSGAGGTWFANTYPGARVDVPSRVYSHTFAVDYPFEHMFAPQPENEKYVNWCVDEFDVRPNIDFSVEVTSVQWNDDSKTWTIEAKSAGGASKEYTANVVIAAVGFLDRPNIPDIPGIDTFTGPLFHTARWDDSQDLTGKRVAIIGTGASACQLAPALADIAGQLTIFQRTPPWILSIPGNDMALPDDMLWLNENVPFYNNWMRLRIGWAVADRNFRPTLYRDPEWQDPISISAGNHAMMENLSAYIRDQVGDDPDLLAKTLPDYPPLAKRFVVDSGWFRTLKRDDVDLVAEAVARIEPNGIVSASDEFYEFDVIVLATGFRATDYLWPMEITGRDGQSIAQRWEKDGARAYNGLTVPGFPNFFMLYGPNTNAFANGPVVWSELQTRYALEWIKLMVERDVAAAEVTKAAYDDFNARLDERLSTSVWMDPAQTSYYVNEFGRVTTNGPWSTEEYWQAIRRPNTDDYKLDGE
jgi:4-hydroxyacetophenone monooxygenase